jgi:hypothetical protein
MVTVFDGHGVPVGTGVLAVAPGVGVDPGGRPGWLVGGGGAVADAVGVTGPLVPRPGELDEAEPVVVPAPVPEGARVGGALRVDGALLVGVLLTDGLTGALVRLAGLGFVTESFTGAGRTSR